MKSLVSIVVPTRNSADTLEACLVSIKQQTYARIELIVVDRDSTDRTKDIAARYTRRVFNHGPERCAQRNFGAGKASGDYVVMIDSDMQLDPKVIEACVAKIQAEPDVKGVIIPEESFGQGFWAQCKRLERSFYVGVSWIEAARFFDKATYEKVGGYDESQVSGEDWDLSRRVESEGEIASVDEFIRHNEGRINLWKTLKKKYYYAQHAKAYFAKNPTESKLTSQVGPIQRYKLFFSHPGKLFRNPILGVSMLFMKTCEFGFGGAGYLRSKRTQGIETSKYNGSKSMRQTKQPIVSVIVTTYNNHATIDACLNSIKQQNYKPIELIVVDNSSTDDTQEISRRYTNQVFTKGPDRSAQRNLAVDKAKGAYIVIIDSDMELSPECIEACVERIQNEPSVVAVAIPEESFGEGFWARCKWLERSYYVGVDWIEYPRFMSKTTFYEVGGYDPTLVGAEDWDFNSRLQTLGAFGRVTPLIRHNEGQLKLKALLRKRMHYYGQGFTRKAEEKNTQATGVRLLFRFYLLYLSQPKRIFRHPVLWSGMIAMRTAEFSARIFGYFMAKNSEAQNT